MQNLSSLEICLVTQQLGRVLSGPGTYARNVLHHLVQDGHKVTVIAPRDQAMDKVIGYRFVGIERSFFASNHARWMGLSLSFRSAIQQLERFTRFDLIHFTEVRDAFFCQTSTPKIGNINDTYCADIGSLAYYFRHYNDWFARWGYYWSVHLFEKMFLAKLDALVANSIFTARTIQKAYPNAAANLFTVYKSVDPVQFLPVLQSRQRASRPLTQPILLMVGSNLQRKGIRSLIRAAADIIPVYPDLQIKVAGNDPAIPGFQRLSSQLGIADHIVFLGQQSREQLIKLYSEATVFILPALTEALGIVFLEAMASGVPVIGTRVGGIPEIIQDGANGLLVPPDDPVALSRAIDSLLQSDSMMEKFAQAGLETVKRFSVEKMMSDTYQVYSHVLGKTE